MMRKETDRENLRIKYSIYPMSIESWLSMEIPDQFPKLHRNSEFAYHNLYS